MMCVDVTFDYDSLYSSYPSPYLLHTNVFEVENSELGSFSTCLIIGSATIDTLDFSQLFFELSDQGTILTFPSYFRQLSHLFSVGCNAK